MPKRRDLTSEVTWHGDVRRESAAPRVQRLCTAGWKTPRHARRRPAVGVAPVGPGRTCWLVGGLTPDPDTSLSLAR
ncbi:hypothetical protein E2C01_078039 [Portunus trituberculatus]|uniref:Uncharacterized protein n=1 Tax=Portunus trituberculatus TaxID=210409 RepID=A0A5B7ICY4_PORTR|nr:hypothetical protein [Portunus trituberculatus]